ncbi:MAG: hypothetical protein Q8912_06315 [Bacillota bacterium]|nr:hypothetical protein [Bacillota bacterium]
MEDISTLRNEDLTRRLQTLSEELEELEEEKSFVLKQTGLHLPGHTVTKYATQIETLKESIGELNAELERRKVL